MSPAAEADDTGAPPSVGPPPAAYVALLVVYVALGFFLKSVVLNWIVGPLVPLVALYLLPRLFRSATATSTE